MPLFRTVRDGFSETPHISIFFLVFLNLTKCAYSAQTIRHGAVMITLWLLPASSHQSRDLAESLIASPRRTSHFPHSRSTQHESSKTSLRWVCIGEAQLIVRRMDTRTAAQVTWKITKVYVSRPIPSSPPTIRGLNLVWCFVS